MAGAVFSGVPSTVWTVVRREDVLHSTRAAGTLLGKASVVRGGIAHLGISLFWTLVLARLLPRRRPVVEGLTAGGAIAALDLGLVARRFPAIRDLDPWPQVTDHLAYGVLVSRALN